MEQNNPNLPPTTFCRSGCGFYGSESFEGHCSKCYKDFIKRKQSSSPVGSAGRASPSISAGEMEVMSSVSQTLAKTNLGSTNETGSTSSSSSSALSSPSTTPSVETATPTIAVPNVDKDKDKEEEATGGAEAKDGASTSSDGTKDKKKRNRCHSCKKKVGLTGFECRCGGLYCSLHRYSDKHDCTFNYKEMAQEQIRRNNPVIVGEKVQKI